MILVQKILVFGCASSNWVFCHTQQMLLAGGSTRGDRDSSARLSSRTSESLLTGDTRKIFVSNIRLSTSPTRRAS